MTAEPPYLTLDEMPEEIRNEIIEDVKELLVDQGYHILSPVKYAYLRKQVRSAALNDAAGMALRAHGLKMTCLQLAAKLKNLSREAAD